MMAETLDRNTVIFRDLPERLGKFLDVKLGDPMRNRYGKHDARFSGPLKGFWHTHLKDDAVLIYRLVNRVLRLIMIVSHSEMEGKRAVALATRLAPFR